jgi:hypothetical protein
MTDGHSRYIRRDDKLDPQKEFNATDSLLSFGDISFAGVAVAGASETPQEFAAYIVSLGHILTRIVLSERLVFFWDEDDAGPWSTHIAPSIREHCKTFCISDAHPAVKIIYDEAIKNSSSVIDPKFAKDMTNSVTAYAPWLTAAGPWLIEHAFAETLGISIAPNPFLSNTYANYSARPISTAEQLVRYTEDLRRDVTREYNLLRGMDIYDLQIPAILSAVLRESRMPNEMISVAAQMHQEAKGFRDWCREMDENPNPRDYSDRLLAVQEELKRLAGALGSKETERLHVSAPLGPGFSVSLPMPTFGKLLNRLNVDIGPSRKVRRFLLPLLTASQQVRNMKDELQRVFGVPATLATEAGDWLQILLEMERKRS